ncbi:MAG: starch-binding protein [Ruminococcaceae bacterium]|nr:starch-binding protein [Oscillospiraceae bacterium]
MKMRLRKPIALLLMLSLLATVLVFLPTAQVFAAPEAEDTLDISIQDGVTLHCWNWSFEEIEANMEIIASLGYTSIQTSPIQKAKQATAGYPSNDWWVYYQPADFRIENSESSALGTKTEFQSMCKTAHEYGIKVIVDVVANHMGNTETGTNGLASTIVADLRDDASCWHDVNKNTSNYSSRLEVTQYCMAGLPDLNTANKKVQNYVLEYLKECIDAGADGFRFDAAKHIETPEDGDLASDFWPTVINGATEYAQSSRGIELYCYGELLDDTAGNGGVGAYTKYMSVTDNIWSASALGAISGGSASGFFANYRKSDDASQLVLWAESHDTYADGSTADVSENNINKTWALIAARADAMSLYLARPANISQLLGAASDTAWGYPEVAAANKFHTSFIGQPEYVANEGDIAYVERGNAGVVLVNCKGAEAEVNVTAHAMADGTYTDQITGNTFTVANGKISGSIGSTGIAVVYQCESCAHAQHDADGYCTACRANVGHSYDDNRTCACGAVLTSERTVYFANTGKWNTVNFYSWYDAVDIYTNAWPGNPMTHVEGDIYSCVVPVDIPNIIFNDTNGTQTDDLSLPAESTGQNLYDYATGEWSTYGEIEKPDEPVTPDTPDDTEKPDTEKPEDEGTVNTQPTEDTKSDSTTETEKNTGKNEPDGISPIVWIIVAVVVVAAGAVAFVIIKKKQ